jgi:hypothetical protein
VAEFWNPTRWDKLDEATVTIECQASDVATAAESSPDNHQADRWAHRSDRRP